MPDPVSALELALKHPKEFSEEIFNNLYVDEFKFGPGKSGKIGLNMISQYVVVPAHTTVLLQPEAPGNELAIHLNCMVTFSALQSQTNTITIRAEQFHITARSLATQRLIDSTVPSAITAGTSIHINVNTEWGRAANLRALAQEVGINADQTLKTEVESRQGYSNAYMRVLVGMFKEKVTQRIHQSIGGNVVVKWEGDKTFEFPPARE